MDDRDAMAAMGLPTSFADGRLADTFAGRKRKASSRASSSDDSDSDSESGAAPTKQPRSTAHQATNGAKDRAVRSGDAAAASQLPAAPSSAHAASSGSDSDSDSGPEEQTASRDVGGLNSANPASVALAREIAAIAAAQQKRKNKKRGGVALQAKRRRKKLAQQARRAAAEAEWEEGEDEEEEDDEQPQQHEGDAAAVAADGEATAETALVPSKKKKRKLGKLQRERLAAQKELEAQAALHHTEVRYWAQRYAYFSRWDEGCALDETGWYSVTPESVAMHQAERMRCDTVIDAFAGLGGNAIQLARTCRHVIAIELDPTRLALARQNARVYGVEHRIEWICGDVLTLLPGLRADVIFLAPPWGGVSYLEVAGERGYDIDGQIRAAMGGGTLGGFELFQRARAVTDNIAFCLPRNCRPEQLQEMAALPTVDPRDGSPLLGEAWAASPKTHPLPCEMEENRVGGKVKMITAYFGLLVQPPPTGEGEEQATGEEPQPQ